MDKTPCCATWRIYQTPFLSRLSSEVDTLPSDKKLSRGKHSLTRSNKFTKKDAAEGSNNFPLQYNVDIMPFPTDG